MSLFDLIRSVFNDSEELNMYKNDYEEKLLKKFGKCNNVNNDIKLLIIADTHGTLNEEKFKDFLDYNKEFDVCIMLGDHYDRDINIILKYIDKDKIYGLLGNHDYNYLDNYNIRNINGQVININGLTILGMEGSFRYKPVKFPSFSQEESIIFFQDKDSVDILISHDTKFDLRKCNRDPAHQGLVGITNYLYEKKVPIHIHGHIHENYDNKLLNDTVEHSVFGYKIINIKKTS